ncbi:MAG: type II secretion system minor pseudopilin GspK [Rubrivivax sp.]|nr:type II secretion system minor pseudopilin GspK [Rubrivivax sp.]
MTAASRLRPVAQRGAALLLAMLVLTLVATLAATMVAQQARAVQVEAAERARAQSAWILRGALDWGRMLLREDGRNGGPDHEGEPWAVPLRESRLSAFLAAERDQSTDIELEAFLSGRIVDAQSRYNLRNLIDDQGKLVPLEVRSLQRLCQTAGLPGEAATRIAEGLRAAWLADGGPDSAGAPLVPARVGELVWLGLSREEVERLEPWVELLPVRAPLNVNTAPREVLAAVFEGLDGGSAERIVQSRGRDGIKSLDALRQMFPESIKFDDTRAAVTSNFFDVYGRVRMGDRLLQERSLVERSGDRGSEVAVVRTERLGPLDRAAERVMGSGPK